MVGDDGFERGDHAGLHRGQRLAAGERRPRRRALHHLPQVGLGEVGELLPGPLAVVGLEHAVERAAPPARGGPRPPRRSASCARSGSRRPPRPGAPARRSRERVGLAAPLVGEVDARGPAREQRAGLRGDGMAGQHEPRDRGRRRRLGPAGVGRGVGRRGSASAAAPAAAVRDGHGPIVPGTPRLQSCGGQHLPSGTPSSPISTSGAPVNLTPSGPPETVLDPESADALAALGDRARRAARRRAATRSPRWWRAGPASSTPGPGSAGTRATTSRRTRTSGWATTAASTGCRQSGWRGSGYVRWRHETNRGFLAVARRPRARRPAAIGETDEADPLRRVPAPARTRLGPHRPRLTRTGRGT